LAHAAVKRRAAAHYLSIAVLVESSG
jgi:hypothetical protein